MAPTKKTRSKQAKAAAPSAGKTTRTGETASGGLFYLYVEVDGIEINGQPVPGQVAADAVADGFLEALTRAKKASKKKS